MITHCTLIPATKIRTLLCYMFEISFDTTHQNLERRQQRTGTTTEAINSHCSSL